MRPRRNKAFSLTSIRRAVVVAVLASLAVIYVSAGSAKPTPVGNYQVCLSAVADACTPTADGGDYSVLAGANPQLNVTVTNDSSSNQTLDYADITVPTGIGLSIDTTHVPQSANYTTFAGTSTSTILQLRNLALAPGVSKSITFFVNSTSATCTDGNWSTVAKTGTQPSAFVFTNPPIKSSGLTSLVAQSCSLEFTHNPAAALKGTIVTDLPYTSLADGADNVTVAPAGVLPVALNGGVVSFSVSAAIDSTSGFSGVANAPFSGGRVLMTGLKSSTTGGPFTITASAAGFATSAVSDPFAITQDGEKCVGPCATLNSNSGNSPLVSIATTGGFAFVGASPAGVPLDPANPGPLGYPLGCQYWKPTDGVTGFVEFDGRTGSGTMMISYYVSMKAIKARYGANVGQQFIPICFGAKKIDQNTGQPIDCTNPGSSDGGWTGDKLDGTGRFALGTSTAVCGIGGYYWGILSSYQDKLDQTQNPVVTGFNGPTNLGQNFRTFVISEPSGWDGRGTG
jgi:hypothetical protein